MSAMKKNIAIALVVLVVALLATSTMGRPNKDCNTTSAGSKWNHTNFGFWGYRPYKVNATAPVPSSSRFIVGGSDNTWRFGFNYSDWATKSGPFYLNDTLVFKYDPPNDTTFAHSVYLLPNYWSFQNCDLRWAMKVGDVNAGGGQGFEFVLKRWQPHYFACGERDGFHCKDGLMKFTILPSIRNWN